MRTLGEIVAVPQIMVVFLGYLPFAMARRSADPRFAAGCGQLMLVRAKVYDSASCHAALRTLMHDGMNLSRNIRRGGGRTDIIDATEGMAKPRALPVWTSFLAGGHIAPWLVLGLALILGAPVAAWLSALAIATVMFARTALAIRIGQPLLSAILTPVGVAVTLAIQWSALLAARCGQRAVTRGRSYDFR